MVNSHNTTPHREGNHVSEKPEKEDREGPRDHYPDHGSGYRHGAPDCPRRWAHALGMRPGTRVRLQPLRLDLHLADHDGRQLLRSDRR